jgi:O-glycosyl hydrolase
LVYRNGIRAFVYWFIEMESELLFIGLQKWNQSFCLLSYRNGIRAFVYWFIEMGSELLFIGIQK